MCHILWIFPVFKSGNRSLVVNYHPNSLSSYVIKVFGRVVRSRIAGFLKSQNFLNSNLHGLCYSRNCQTQFLYHVDNVLKALRSGSNTDIIYLDFTKEFDKVDYNILLSNLSNIGTCGKLPQWIEYFLDNSTQHVINGINSSPAKSPSNVPRGIV